MSLRLYNTLSGKVEEFLPSRANTVRMYACGPTVYDYGHIGNFRTFLAVDILRRFLRQSGYQLDHVMNITDVEDKIIRNAAREHKTVQEYTRKYEEAFLEDMRTLNLEAGQSAKVPVTDGKKSALARVDCLRPETVKTPAGSFKTYRYEAYLFDDVIYHRSGRVFIWLTDDSRRLPVQIQVRLQLAIGTITLQLEKEGT